MILLYNSKKRKRIGPGRGIQLKCLVLNIYTHLSYLVALINLITSKKKALVQLVCINPLNDSFGFEMANTKYILTLKYGKMEQNILYCCYIYTHMYFKN